MDAQEIEGLLPHRPPALLIDRVVELAEGRLIAERTVRDDEPGFTGHFPGLPIFPGALLIEAMAQAGAVLAGKTSGMDPRRQIFLLLGVDRARFRRKVVPGDTLRIEVTLLQVTGDVFRLRAQTQVTGQIAAEADILGMIAPREAAA
jgi:3-hydroxyacyl-[acyl-carrier-protein] dehydratase